MNQYSFGQQMALRNSSMFGSSAGMQKPPATFGEYLKRLFSRLFIWAKKGYSVGKNILWCASIGRMGLIQHPYSLFCLSFSRIPWRTLKKWTT